MQTEQKPSIGEIIADITDQIKGLVQGEIALAKTQAKEKVAPFGPAIGMFLGAAVFGLIGLCWLIFTGYLALTEAFAPWLAGLITTGAIFLIVAILGLVGKSLITTASKRKITVGDNLKADVEALKEGFRR